MLKTFLIFPKFLRGQEGFTNLNYLNTDWKVNKTIELKHMKKKTIILLKNGYSTK